MVPKNFQQELQNGLKFRSCPCFWEPEQGVDLRIWKCIWNIYEIFLKQDKVNTANSAFIFLIILLISQNKWSGW